MLSASGAPGHSQARAASSAPATGEHPGALSVSAAPGHRPHVFPAAEACSWPVTPRGYRSPVIPAAPGTVKPERSPVPRPLSRPEHPERLPGTITGLRRSLPLESGKHPGMDPGLMLSLLLRPVHGRSLSGAVSASGIPVTVEASAVPGLICPLLLPATVKPERPPVPRPQSRPEHPNSSHWRAPATVEA